MTHYNTDDDDDSDKDPNYKEEREKSPSPVPMKRKKSLIKRSKDGISKVTKKATKLLTRGRKNVKEVDEEPEEEKEEEINYFIDTEFDNVKTVPRVSEKFITQSEKLLEDFIYQKDPAGASTSKIVDYKTTQKKDALQKKIASGTLNDNYVRVNLKKKVFVRGKKAFNFSRYKKTVWKSKKQAADLNDMRGCDGGVLKCFNCGGVGHFAQQCKQKGDSLMPLDADVEEESNLPTLQQAAEMAEELKLLVHASKPNSIPSASNDVWKDEENSNDEPIVNKENQNVVANHVEEVVVAVKKVKFYFNLC
jgi:ATP-dependent DNA helicase Q4